jgi:hypothetical protein
MLSTPKYSQALRAIGQNLEELNFKAFDIKSEGKDYLVRAAASPEVGELRYTPEDIQRLERQGRLRRSDPFGTPDFISPSQILRAVGDYLDTKDGRLVGISRRAPEGAAPLLTIEYDTRRDRKREEFLFSALYNLSVSMYKQRRAAE